MQIVHYRYDKCPLRLPGQAALLASTPILSFQQLRLKSLRLLRIERS